jgi:hypothetical protein
MRHRLDVRDLSHHSSEHAEETAADERTGTMDRHEMRTLIERHLKAEGAGDVEGAVAVYAEDVVHDAVGFPDHLGSARTRLGSSTGS